MSQVIRVSTETYKRLEGHSKGFDTPSAVIERLLNSYDGISESITSKPAVRDTTLYEFNNETYKKGRLVLAIIKKYVLDNPAIDYSGLLDVFPKKIQGSSGVFLKVEEAREIYKRTGHKRNFLKKEELVALSDCTIAICSQWGSENIGNVIQKAEQIKYIIEFSN